MSYFEDILDGVHNQLDVDASEPTKFEEPKQVSFKIKSSGPGGMKLSKGMDMVPKGDGWAFKSKSEIEKKMDDEHSLKLTAKNKEYEGAWNFAPADLNKDGQNVNIRVKGTCNPAGKKGADCDVEGKISFGGFGSDTVKSWTEIEACTDLKTLHKTEACQNIEIKSDGQTYHLGAKGVYCNEHKKTEEIYAQIAAKGFSWGSAWARAAVLNTSSAKGQFVSVGGAWNHECTTPHHHAMEATYDVSNKLKGFQGLPLLLCYSHCIHMKSVKYVHQFQLGSQWLVKEKAEFDAGDGFKLGYNTMCDLKKLGDLKNFWNKAGLTVEYKL